MKKFKKISAIFSGLLMVGMTAGIAAAASYPAPFVDNGVADVAIVYGTGVGVSTLDMVQAGNIQTSLGGSVEGEATTIEGGDSYKFEKTSTKFNLGNNITGVIASSINDDELPVLLKPGKYLNDENAEIDYTQKIVIGANNQLTMFTDNDYKEDEPTVGFRIPASQEVLTYTLTFDDTLYVKDMPTTDLPIMGTSYYVLSNTSTTTLTLLDSATETVLSEGETATVDGKQISVEYIGSATTVKLNVAGEITNTLNAGDTYKLNDGSYVGIKEILYSTKEGTISKVEFSLGSGKLKLTNGEEVQINDNAVPGLTSAFSITGAGVIPSIALTWTAEDALFITEGNSITMPSFEAVSLSYGGLNYPLEETIEVQKGGTTYAQLNNFPLKDGEVDINFLYGDSTSYTQLGKDGTGRLVTANIADGNSTLTFDKDLDDYFVVSWTDASDAESYLVRFTNFVGSSTETNKTDFQYYNDGAWVTKKAAASDADEISLGNAEIMIGSVSNTNNNVSVWNNSAETSFDKLFSEEGMTVYLPFINSTDLTISNDTEYTAAAACSIALGDEIGELYTGTVTYNSSSHADATTSACATTFVLAMREENKAETKYAGDWVNVTLGWDSSSTPVVEVDAVDTTNTDATLTEILETDVWRDFAYSELATEVLFNKPDSGQNSVKIMYHGDEVTADVYITSADAIVTSGSDALGDVLVMDSEISTVQSKNLVIVGGSCINSAAATVLGGAYCGAAFTEATGVGEGQFLIKGVQDAYTTGKLALVVAGYEAADTVNAATYLTMKDVDTSAEYKGTSATEATLVVA